MHEFFIIGHRGAAGEKFENSLSGFEYALTLDIDAIELDVRAHSGELWVIHDGDLDRLTNSSGKFDSIENPASLRLLNNEPIPKLHQILDLAWGRIPVNIEIKSSDTADLLLGLLYQYPTIEAKSIFPWILISSFDHKQILRLRRQSCPWALAPIISGIPTSDQHLIDEIRPYSIHMDDEYLDFGMIEQVQHKGVRVMVYTINDLYQAQKLKKCGINGIFTNYPSKLLNIE